MSSTPNLVRLPVVDTETFGLNSRTDPIIELGIAIVDLDLKIQYQQSWLVWSKLHDMRHDRMIRSIESGDKSDEWVCSMHSRSHLFEDARQFGQSIGAVEQQVINYMKDYHIEGTPMVGSSVHFDQRFITEQMPELSRCFSYRIIDVSVLKELCKRWHPTAAASVPAAAGKHRVIPDIKDTIEELRWYKDHFLVNGMIR